MSVFALLHNHGHFDLSMDVKRSCLRREDAITWLPDDVLGKILSLLPTRQAVSTSILSKKWRYVFRLVDNQNLDFDDSSSMHGRVDKQGRYLFPKSFENFVDRTLALQCDHPIKKFSLKCCLGEDNEPLKACVARWISNVAGRGVLEAELRINSWGIDSLPPQLLSCKTLVKLTIGTQILLNKVPSYVSLPSLKFLFLDTAPFPYLYLCGVLLAGCPVLEDLSVRHKNFVATPHTISSPTIKRLSIDYDSLREVDYDSIRSFVLPKLVYLDYSDFALGRYNQISLDSLVEAKLDLRPANVSSWRLKPDVTDLIAGIRNVEILRLSPVSADVIYSYCRRGLPLFDNLVSLSFGSKNQRGWNLLPCLLKQSPKLETLIIQDLHGYTGDVSMPPNKVKSLVIPGYRGTDEELIQLKSFLREFKYLKVVRVVVAGASSEDDDVLLRTKKDLIMVLGLSRPQKVPLQSHI